MKLDTAFIKEVLQVAFPGFDSILVVASDADATFHGYCLAGKGDHESLLESACETVVSHLHGAAGHNLQEVHEKDEGEYHSIMAAYCLLTGLNYLKKSIDVQPDLSTEELEKREKVLESIVDLTSGLVEKVHVAKGRMHD